MPPDSLPLVVPSYLPPPPPPPVFIKPLSAEYSRVPSNPPFPPPPYNPSPPFPYPRLPALIYVLPPPPPAKYPLCPTFVPK